MSEPLGQSRIERVEAGQWRGRRLYETAKILLITASFALLIVIILRGQTQSAELLNIARENHASNILLVNCTTPGHQCYDDGEARTAGAVKSINQIVTAAAYCARTLPASVDEPTLERCVSNIIVGH